MKRIISFIISAALIAACAVLPSSALMGKWGDVLWEIENGVLTVSGGNIPDSTASSAAPWMKFADNVKTVVVGKGVSVIGERAFEDMTSAESVSFGSAATLGRMAFSGCTALTSVSLPESVKTVGDAVFAECISLEKISLPSSLTFLGKEVFEGCTALTQIVSASERYPAPDGVLTDSKNSSVLRYPPAKKGASYTVPAGITAVSDGAFRDCVYLTSADLSGIITVGDGAFYGCTSLETVVLTSVTSVGRAAFYGCTSLTQINFGEKLTQIGSDAFRDCIALTVAHFEGDAPNAPEGIFYGTSLSFIVTVNGDSAGFNDTWLGYPVIRHGIYSGKISGVSWSLDTGTGIITLTGEGAIPDFEYPSDAPWYKYRKLIREITIDGITGIGKNSFRYSSVQSLTLPKSVKHIGDWAFSGCEALTEVTANSVTSVGSQAFFGDIALRQVMMNSASQVGDQAFSGCDDLWWVFLGKTAPTVGKYVFDGTDVAVLYLPGSVGYSGSNWNDLYCEEYYAGDANGDGRFNLSDVSTVMKSIAKWKVALKKISADINLDGKVNLTDASNMLKHIAKWDGISMGIPITSE